MGWFARLRLWPAFFGSLLFTFMLGALLLLAVWYVSLALGLRSYDTIGILEWVILSLWAAGSVALNVLNLVGLVRESRKRLEDSGYRQAVEAWVHRRAAARRS